MKRQTCLLVALLFALGFARCGSLQVTLPAGFVKYSADHQSYRAVSADGMVIRALKEKNDPPSSPALWAKALRMNLEKRGYQIKSDENAKTSGGWDGVLIRAGYKYENQDYLYLCAIYLNGSDLWTVEAAGPAAILAPRQKELEDTIRTIRLQ